MAVLVPMAAGAQVKEPYAVLSNGNSVLTFYYDDQKAARHGMDVGPFSGEPSWYAQRGDITSVVFDASFADCTTLTSTAYWFYGLKTLSTITGIGNLRTDNVTDMRGMFRGCSYLLTLDVSGFKTDNVTDMKEMFASCTGLTNLDLSGFKTDKVTSMNRMFYGCWSLASIDLSGFNTDNVTDMKEMFRGLWDLKSLDLSGFRTEKVTDMTRMFGSCSSLKTIYAGDGWSTAKVVEDGEMFYNCLSIVGGAGTRFDDSHTDKTYARIDGGADKPGYLTWKDGSSEKPEGDLSGDGKVGSDDVVVILDVLMGGDKDRLAAADLNHDGKVDVADVVMLVKMILDEK